MKKVFVFILSSLISFSAFSLSLVGIKQFSYPDSKGINHYFIQYDNRNMMYLQVGKPGFFSKNYYCEFFPLNNRVAQWGKKTVSFQNDKFGFIDSTRYTYDEKKLNLALYTGCAGDFFKPEHIRH